MAIRNWKRMRTEAAKHRSSAPREDANPWDEERPTLSQLGSFDSLDGTGKAAEYSAWAGRLRAKRQRDQATASTDKPTYWTTDALFAESKRLQEDDLPSRPNPWKVKELLAVLDLREGASHEEIGSAYKRLAKQHHPDRFVEADENTQLFHADRMTTINRAYRALKQLESV